MRLSWIQSIPFLSDSIVVGFEAFELLTECEFQQFGIDVAFGSDLKSLRFQSSSNWKYCQATRWARWR